MFGIKTKYIHFMIRIFYFEHAYKLKNIKKNKIMEKNRVQKWHILKCKSNFLNPKNL